MAMTEAMPLVALSDDEEARAVAAAREDPRRFADLYERHVTAVFRYVRARCGDDDEAADLTATTFERALRGLHGYRGDGAGFRAWLMRIARNATVDAARERRRTEPLEALRGEREPAAAEAAGTDSAIARTCANELLAGLPDLQRDAVVLRYASGLTAADIGEVIGKSESATKKLLSRAMATMKEAYRAGERRDL